MAKPPKRLLTTVLGAVALVVGIGLLGYGLAPLKQMADAVGPTFSGGPPPEDLSDRLDASMAALTARAWADGVGFILLLVGILMVKAGLAKPTRSIEQMVNEEVARRLAVPAARSTAPGASPPEPAVVPALTVASSSPPSIGPASSSPHVPLPPMPALPAAARRTHCAACGSILVAGGRLCPQGHAQA